MQSLLSVKNLKASINDKIILNDFNLEIQVGEIHAIMGPNGSGKSTFSKILIGHEDYEILEGSIEFFGQNILEMDASDRALMGIFLGFQYPVEVPGVSNLEFMHIAYNAKQKYENKESIDKVAFKKILLECMEYIDLHNDIYYERSVNEGFSGGEKKRNEILQMAVLEPKLTILDEIDSSLDIDALKMVAYGVNKIMNKNKNQALILITHHQRLLDYIKPTHVHIMIKGQIIKSGGAELALELEKNGYDNYLEITA